MYFQEWTAIFLYLLVLTGIGFFSYKKHISASAFIMGNRSMNVWLTALAAHASDMSSWLFMAYPGSVFTHGYLAIWTAIGLIVCMYANWKWIAPKIRVATEQYNAFTFSSFFESRYADTSGRIRIFSSLVLMLFYTIYIAAQLTTLGENLEVLFNTHYITGILLGVCIITPYVFAGGYLTLARIDLFQGLFLLGVILFVPFHLLPKVGGFAAIKESMNSYALPSLFPDYSPKSFLTIL